MGWDSFCIYLEAEVSMEEQRYNVILSYDPDDKKIHQKVVSALFEKAPLAAQRFEEANFNGRMMIRRGVDLKTAKGFARLFRDTGAICQFQKTAPTPASANQNLTETERSQGPQPEMAECPNCGHAVPKLIVECPECGIIIAKAKLRRVPQPTTEPAEQAPSPPPSIPPSILEKAKVYCSPLVKVLQKIQHPIPIEKISGWGQTVVDRLIRCGLVFVIALILEVGLLVLGRMMWSLYTATISGEHYLKTFPEKAAVLNAITGANPLNLGFETTFIVLCLGLLVGCVAQLLHLIHHLYESQHLIGKLIIWFTPFIGTGAWIMTRQAPYLEFFHATVLVALPALCLFSSCLYLAKAMLPELGMILKLGTTTVGNISGARGIILQNIREWIQSFKQGR